jgi:hypothetical protein
MRSEEGHVDAAGPRAVPECAHSDGTRLSRRQAIGRMSAIASAGAVAWVAPEILTAKPAGGATLSGPTLLTGGSPPGPTPTGTPTGTPADPGTEPAATPDPAVVTGASTGTAADGSSTGPGANPATTPGTSLAFTGVDIQRDAEIGAALVAGGWALHHWASRTTATRTTATRTTTTRTTTRRMPTPPAESPGKPI